MPAMTVTLRDATLLDASRLGIVKYESWIAAFSSIGIAEHLIAPGPEGFAEQWRVDIAAAEPGDIVVAEEDGVVIGYRVIGTGRGHAHPGEMELETIYLHPDAWGKSVGSLLMANAIENMRARGATRAFLWMHPLNERAEGFYEAKGWRKDGPPRDDVYEGTLMQRMVVDL